jgi:tRNA (guanine-N7-)-methyltransferase
MDLHFRDVSNYSELQKYIKEGKENNKKLYLEIGFGSGIVLRKRVLNEADILHIGFEIKGKFVRRLNIFKEKWNIKNLLVERADAKYAIPRFVEENTFDKIFIFYPDPWWKKKHKKYILFDYYFMADLYRSLKPNGVLNIKTDVEEYYELIKEKFDNFGHFTECDFDDLTSDEHKSSFEIIAIEE